MFVGTVTAHVRLGAGQSPQTLLGPRINPGSLATTGPLAPRILVIQGFMIWSGRAVDVHEVRCGLLFRSWPP